MTTLKQEVIKGLTAEGAFDMGAFGGVHRIIENKGKTCCTSFCLAGHIVAAAARLRRKIPKYEECDILDREDECHDTAVVGREIWRRTYGLQQAKALKFWPSDYKRYESSCNPDFILEALKELG